MKTQELFGVPIATATFKEAVQHLILDAHSKEKKAKVVVTPNVDHVVMLDRRPEIKSIYLKADYFFADGWPIVFASNILNKRIPERVTGADLMPELLLLANNSKMKVFIVGGFPGEESNIYSKLKQLYPDVNLSIYSPANGFKNGSQDSDKIIEQINFKRPDMVFVCIGYPRQEVWAIQNKELLQANLVLCVGAALDFIVGKVKRAPITVRKLKMEWLWRLLSDPKRLWRRYILEDTKFVGILAKEYFQRAKN
ncbi:MAG: WecB/TagA/CpsF family glycosyltransferase [Pseudomonas sp.]|uniref:WecB/TagA/CpsF family glycosyltransferase n=1 Tax=Pseudomonas sp. TaxID=306 RepID=UPI003D1165C6